MAPLTIHLNNFDPAAASSSELRNNALKSRFWLFVLKAPMTVAQLGCFRSRSLIVDYQYPNNAYIVKVGTTFDPKTSLTGLDFISSAVPFPPEAVVPNKQAFQGKSEHEVVDVAITLHDGAERKTREVLADILKITPATRSYCGDKTIVASVVVGKVFDIAKIDDIRSIDLHREPEPASITACEMMEVFQMGDDGKGHPTLVWNNWTGKDQVIGILDSGLDNGDLTALTVHALEDKVIDIVMLADDGTSDPIREPDRLADMTGHGTHVAACALGLDIAENHDPLRSICGPAPGAKLFCMKRQGNIPVADLLTVSNYGLTKLSILSNSWGWTYDDRTEHDQRPYTDARAGAVDRIMFEDPTKLVIFAAGNDGMAKLKQKAHVSDTAASKNALVVGACTSSRPFVPTASNFEGKYDQHGNVVLKRVPNFSSKGPTFEGFLKPDVVAPGVALLSSRSSELSAWDFKKLEDSFGKSPEARFRFHSGTSMAAPLVAGCGACLREACVKTRPHSASEPSAPLLKALIVNGTSSLAGGTALLPDPTEGSKAELPVHLVDPPDYAQGYGTVNLRRSLVPVVSEATIEKGYADCPNFDLSKHSETEPTIWSQDIVIASVKSTVRATLAYNDSPGAALNADLLLELHVGGNAVLPRTPSPWKDEKMADVTQPTPFQRGNLQKIVWPCDAKEKPGVKGKLSVTVKKRDMTSPNKVSFAVVWWVEHGEGA